MDSSSSSQSRASGASRLAARHLPCAPPGAELAAAEGSGAKSRELLIGVTSPLAARFVLA